MTYDTLSRYDHLIDDEVQWLEEVREPEEPRTPQHACGNCKTPFGRSALPCPNDPDYDPNQRLRERLGT